MIRGSFEMGVPTPQDERTRLPNKRGLGGGGVQVGTGQADAGARPVPVLS